MRALGIDLGRPGGLALLSDDQRGKPRCLAMIEVPRRISDLDYQKLMHWFMKAHKPDVIAAERPGHWGRAVIGMSQSRDDALATAAAQALQIPYRHFEPHHIKAMVAADGHASKRAVKDAIRDLVQIEDSNEHISDAAAIALVALKGPPAGNRAATRPKAQPAGTWREKPGNPQGRRRPK
jgi:Holliday junction resolvasome RuvABC endonuclease subunit